MPRINLTRKPKRLERRTGNKGPGKRGGILGWKGFFSKKYRFGIGRTFDDDARLLDRYEAPGAVVDRREPDLPDGAKSDVTTEIDLRIGGTLHQGPGREQQFVTPKKGVYERLRAKLKIRKTDPLHITVGYIAGRTGFPIGEVFARTGKWINKRQFFKLEPRSTGAALYGEVCSGLMHAVEAGRLKIGPAEIEDFITSRKLFMSRLRKFVEAVGVEQGNQIVIKTADIEKHAGKIVREMPEIVKPELRRLRKVLVDGKTVVVEEPKKAERRLKVHLQPVNRRFVPSAQDRKTLRGFRSVLKAAVRYKKKTGHYKEGITLIGIKNMQAIWKMNLIEQFKQHELLRWALVIEDGIEEDEEEAHRPFGKMGRSERIPWLIAHTKPSPKSHK